MLKSSGVDYALHHYKYEEKGGTERAALELKVDEHQVLKTLIMEDNTGEPMVVIMHGDKQVSTKALARVLNVKTITPCEPKAAHQHTGYFVGGTSPLGLKKPLKIYFEKSASFISRFTLLVNPCTKECPPTFVAKLLAVTYGLWNNLQYIFALNPDLKPNIAITC